MIFCGLSIGENAQRFVPKSTYLSLSSEKFRRDLASVGTSCGVASTASTSPMHASSPLRPVADTGAGLGGSYRNWERSITAPLASRNIPPAPAAERKSVRTFWVAPMSVEAAAVPDWPGDAPAPVPRPFPDLRLPSPPTRSDCCWSARAASRASWGQACPQLHPRPLR